MCVCVCVGGGGGGGVCMCVFAYCTHTFVSAFSLYTSSRSASDNIWTIIEKTESVYVQKFQHLIKGTLCSGKFSKSLTNEQEAVGTYFASGFIDQ